MNGPQDLGGQMGFGRIVPEADEPVFHADWEGRALAITLLAGMMGAWTLDESRFSRERLHPADYYSSSYYEIWIKALESLLVEHGFVSAEELAEGAVLEPGARPKRVPSAAEIGPILKRGGPTEREMEASPRFAPGDRVRTRVMHPSGHTRLPRYARGKTGRIESAHGGHVFPDSNAAGAGEAPQHLYTVVFAGPEIWGSDCDPQLTVSIDAWESYLEPA